MDPRADDVAEVHPGLREDAFRDTVHLVRLFEGVAARPVDVAGVHIRVAAQSDDRPARSRRAARTGARAGSAHVVCGNVPTANATVYLIDSVLLPK